MATELTKQPASSEQIATWKSSYRAAWNKAFKEVMFLMAEQYSLELSVEIPETGERVPSPMMKLWEEELGGLSPLQMREGLKGYMRSERRSFKPTPEDIRDNAPEEATDRPRKVKNPNCSDCGGSGFRMVEIDSRIFPGKKVNAVTDCYCVRIEYNGESYIPEQRQLPSAVDSARVKDVEAKIDSAAKGEAMPRVQGMTDAEYNERQQVLERQKAKLLK